MLASLPSQHLESDSHPLGNPQRFPPLRNRSRLRLPGDRRRAMPHAGRSSLRTAASTISGGSASSGAKAEHGTSRSSTTIEDEDMTINREDFDRGRIDFGNAAQRAVVARPAGRDCQEFRARAVVIAPM